MSPETGRSSDHPEVQFPVLRWFSKHGIKTRKIVASLHSGTHVDAPSMYFHDGLTIDQLPLEGFVGEAVVVNAALGDWGVISATVLDDIARDVQRGDIIALWTGFGEHYLNEEKYILKAPGLDKSGVDWLVDRGIKAVFSDTPSPEHIFMRSGQWKTLRPDVFEYGGLRPR